MCLQDAAKGTARSYAAYLFMVAINEHDCRLRGEQVVSALRPLKEEDGQLWLNRIHILAGIRREVDFLSAVMEGARIQNLNKKHLVMFLADPVIEAYRSACRVDLGKHGLVNIVLEAK